MTEEFIRKSVSNNVTLHDLVDVSFSSDPCKTITYTVVSILYDKASTRRIADSRVKFVPHESVSVVDDDHPASLLKMSNRYNPNCYIRTTFTSRDGCEDERRIY